MPSAVRAVAPRLIASLLGVRQVSPTVAGEMGWYRFLAVVRVWNRAERERQAEILVTFPLGLEGWTEPELCPIGRLFLIFD